MHCPSSPFRNPGLHLQVKPTGEETLGAKRHNWSHFVFSQGLFAWGCSAIWLASTDRGCETRCDTTVSFLPLYFLKREKKQMSSCTAFKHARSMYFYFRKLIRKKTETLHYCFAIGILIRASVLIFWTKKYWKTNVEFLSNHDVIFLVNSCKKNNNLH